MMYSGGTEEGALEKRRWKWSVPDQIRYGTKKDNTNRNDANRNPRSR